MYLLKRLYHLSYRNPQTNKIRRCAECRKCHEDYEDYNPEEYDEPAMFYVTGYVDDHPYRAYVCQAHTCMLEEDGWNIRATTLIGSPEWYKEMDELTRYYTGYDSFRQLCADKPTLRIHEDALSESIANMRRLREGYRLETGRTAYL